MKEPTKVSKKSAANRSQLMKVWIVVSFGMDDCDIHGVYSTFEKAKAAARSHFPNGIIVSNDEPIEFELDAPPIEELPPE